MKTHSNEDANVSITCGRDIFRIALFHFSNFILSQTPQTRSHSDAQKATFDLLNGLMSLIQQSTMPELAQEAMDALLCLHQPANIRLWNLHAPAQTFWEIRSAACVHYEDTVFMDTLSISRYPSGSIDICSAFVLQYNDATTNRWL